MFLYTTVLCKDFSLFHKLKQYKHNSMLGAKALGVEVSSLFSDYLLNKTES